MKKLLCLLLAGFMITSFTGCAAWDKVLEVKDTVFDIIDTKNDPVGELTLEDDLLKVGMYMHMPPMSSVTEDTVTPVGFEVDLAHAIADTLGLKLQIVDITQDNLLPSLDADIVDCVISSVPVTAENTERYLASVPYADLSQIADILPENINAGEAAIFIAQDNEALMYHLENTLISLIDSGDLSLLSQTHFEKDIIITSEE